MLHQNIDIIADDSTSTITRAVVAQLPRCYRRGLVQSHLKPSAPGVSWFSVQFPNKLGWVKQSISLYCNVYVRNDGIVTTAANAYAPITTDETDDYYWQYY